MVVDQGHRQGDSVVATHQREQHPRVGGGSDPSHDLYFPGCFGPNVRRRPSCNEGGASEGHTNEGEVGVSGRRRSCRARRGRWEPRKDHPEPFRSPHCLSPTTADRDRTARALGSGRTQSKGTPARGCRLPSWPHQRPHLPHVPSRDHQTLRPAGTEGAGVPCGPRASPPWAPSAGLSSFHRPCWSFTALYPRHLTRGLRQPYEVGSSLEFKRDANRSCRERHPNRLYTTAYSELHFFLPF